MSTSETTHHAEPKLAASEDLPNRVLSAATKTLFGAASASQEDTDLVTGLTLDALGDHLQACGLRVETVRDGEARFLRSATNGLTFDIRPGNAFAAASDRFADVTFVALFAVSGTLPLDLLNRWNQSHRFGRLFLDSFAPDRNYLVFCMDVSVAGGVMSNHLHHQIVLWDGLIQQLIPWLREEVSKIVPTVDTASNMADIGRVEAPDTSEVVVN
ncbi:MAG: YbjN domain-containing protein [Aquamicrobium sp.]|uniref:YbjN domain-containing protein n=1 Tax=Mesorhizobium sp. Pch-S TaxID=2082387 RepID=UPI0013EDEB96|nr:YbjN domain-containing protein [Mesorhizobium sp. Pch-S]MBR2691502.1 YbjN domain-containing protein [Aquamicrobium sp.]